MSGNEASSDPRNSGEQQLDRNDYQFFTDEEFNIFSKMGKQIVEVTHLSCKQLYEDRIANFSLDLPKVSHLQNDLKIVLYGKTGSGKSSTANAILGKEVFKANVSSNSVTQVSLDNTCTYKNRRITVVDTPGIHDTGRDNETIVKELARMAFLLQDGVHCFVICMSASDSRFTKEVIEMLQLIKQGGRGDFFDYCMLAYTKAETELGRCSLREFLVQKKKHKTYSNFLENINERVVAVNNKSLVPAEALRNRDALIEMADVVVADNRRNGKPVIFTNDLFKKAGALRVKLAYVVLQNNFHPILVNATIEAIVNNCSSRLTFDVFLNEVESIITMRETSEVNNMVNAVRTHQVKQIYDEINEEVNGFMESIHRIVLAVKVVHDTATAAVATVAAASTRVGTVAAVSGGATVVVAAATGTPALAGATLVVGAAAVGATTVAAAADVAEAVGATAGAIMEGVKTVTGVLIKKIF